MSPQRRSARSLQDLEKKFEKYGPVREARIVRNPRSGESRGFGFLIMENDDDVDRVSAHHIFNQTPTCGQATR